MGSDSREIDTFNDKQSQIAERKREILEIDTFNDKQSQIAERKTGDGRGPGDCSKEAA